MTPTVPERFSHAAVSIATASAKGKSSGSGSGMAMLVFGGLNVLADLTEVATIALGV